MQKLNCIFWNVYLILFIQFVYGGWQILWKILVQVMAWCHNTTSYIYNLDVCATQHYVTRDQCLDKYSSRSIPLYALYPLHLIDTIFILWIILEWPPKGSLKLLSAFSSHLQYAPWLLARWNILRANLWHTAWIPNFTNQYQGMAGFFQLWCVKRRIYPTIMR